MRQVPCPRCNGTGVVEEDGTLVGLSPFQDRPSGVNDDEWVAPPEEHGEPTRVQEVPSFKMPKETPLRLPSPKPPRDLTRMATDSERPTRIIHRREELMPKRAVWPWVLVAVVVAVAGISVIQFWFPSMYRVIVGHLGW